MQCTSNGASIFNLIKMKNYLKSFDLTDLRDLFLGGLFITVMFQILYLVEGL